MKIIKVTFIILIFSVLFFAGCNDNKNIDQSGWPEVKCVLIGGGDYEHIYENIPDFENKYKIKINIVYKNKYFELDRKLKIEFETCLSNYDLISNHSSFYSQYIDFLRPLNEYFTYEDLEDFLPRLVSAVRKDGNLYLVPRHADISSLHYRTDLFEDPQYQENYFNKFNEKLKVPDTWDEFERIALFFNSPPDLYGTQFAGKEEALTGRFYEILISHGGEFIDEYGNAAFNSYAGIKTVNMLRNLYTQNAMPPDTLNYIWDDLAQNMKGGKIALAPEWYSYFSYFQYSEDSLIADKFDIAPLPKGDAGIRSGWGGIHGFSIPKNSQNPDEAALFIKYMTNTDNSYIEAKKGYLPVRNSVWNKIIKEAEISNNPLEKKRLEIAKKQFSEDFISPPIIPEWIPASNILFPILQNIISGEISAEAGLKNAEKEVNKILE